VLLNYISAIELFDMCVTGQQYVVVFHSTKCEIIVLITVLCLNPSCMVRFIWLVLFAVRTDCNLVHA